MRRAALLPIHRWLGLILAPFLILQALTGSVLVVHELSLGAPPSHIATVATFRAGAEAAAPGFHVTRLYLPGSTGARGFAEMAGPDGARAYAELDPASGRALATGALWRFPYRFAVQVHYRLADGATGMTVVLLTGLTLAFTALSGFAFWWPGARRVAPALKVRRGLPARLRLRQWHRTVGAFAAVLALFSATTGVLLVAPDLVPAAPGPVAPAPPPPSAGQIDAAVAAAQARFPGAALRDVRFPPADRIYLNFDAPERNARAVHTVSVRPSDGDVATALAARDNPVLWMKVLALHTGEFLGLAGMLLLLGEAAALVFLAWAGTRMWLAAHKKAKTR